MLRVEQDNTRARCFYEAHGFRHTGEYAEEFHGHIIHKLEMILRPQIPLLEPSPPRVESGDSNNQVTVE